MENQIDKLFESLTEIEKNIVIDMLKELINNRDSNSQDGVD